MKKLEVSALGNYHDSDKVMLVLNDESGEASAFVVLDGSTVRAIVRSSEGREERKA